MKCVFCIYHSIKCYDNKTCVLFFNTMERKLRIRNMKEAILWRSNSISFGVLACIYYICTDPNACSLYLFLLIVIVINPCDAIKHSFLIVLFNQKICLCINAWDSVGVFVSFCHILGPWVYMADMKRQVTDNFSGGRKAGARNGGVQNFCGNKLHMNEFIVYSWEIIWDAYAERVHRTINTNHPFTLRYMHKKTETNTENGEPFERTSIFNGWDKVSLIYVYRIWCKVCKTREKKERKKTSTT